ncbi:MAG: hypothetical protein OWV35_00015 [Firmicutes bacterium]|nr:hypothetical protein [Bacillota bacterium]
MVERTVPCPVADRCRARGATCAWCADGSAYAGPGRYPRVPVPRTQPDPAHRRRGQHAQRKGRRLEQAFAHRFGGRRMPLSGALDGHPGDVVLPNGWRYECRGRETGYALAYRWVAAAGWAVVTDGTRWMLLAREDVAALVLAGAPRVWPPEADRLPLPALLAREPVPVTRAHQARARRLRQAWTVERPPVWRSATGPVVRTAQAKTLFAWLFEDRRERPDGLALKADRKPWLLAWDLPHAVALGFFDSLDQEVDG